MVSLHYGTTDAIVSGELAMEIVQDMQAHTLEITQPSSFRFHMATALGGAIIILATLLSRDLSVLGLLERHTSYAESYKQGVFILRDLAVNLHCASRILEDMKSIIKVVDLVLQQNHSPGAMQSGALLDVVPANMEELFPYDPVNFNSMFTAETLGGFATFGGVTDPNGIDQDLGDQGMSASWDALGDAPLRGSGGYGVPWV